MKKIALFLPSLRGGGAERVMLNLAKGFAKEGYSVDLVLATAEGPYLSQVPTSVRIVDLKSKRVISSLPSLVKYLRHERPDSMLSALNHANVTAIWAKKLAGVQTRLVISEHNTLSRSLMKPNNYRQRIIPPLMRRFYPMADAIVCVSEGVADDLSAMIRIPRKNIHVIYNPIVSDEMMEKANQPLDHPWFQKGQPPVILSVGRLTEQKDHPTLLYAFHEVRKQIPARLMILGEGEKRPELESIIQKLDMVNDVSLPGFVENPYAYMKRASVFVLTSKWEGFGNVLVEAMACGTPVISTDCPSGPREILQDGKYGVLVPIGKPLVLADEILEILQSKDSMTSYSTLIQLFSTDRVVEEYFRILFN